MLKSKILKMHVEQHNYGWEIDDIVFSFAFLSLLELVTSTSFSKQPTAPK